MKFDQLGRREFITLIGGAAVASPIVKPLAGGQGVPIGYNNLSNWPSQENRPTVAGLTLTWIGPVGGGASTASDSVQTKVLSTAGSVSSSTNGQVIQNLNINGTVTIRHKNVTLRRCRIASSDYHVVSTIGPTGAVIEDCLVDGEANAAGGILPEGGNGTIIRRCNITKCVDGIKVGENGIVIVDTWIHDLQNNGPDPHYDGIQCIGGINGLTIHHNAIWGRDTACVNIGADPYGPWQNVQVTSNLLVMQGGAYALGIGGGTNVTVTNNSLGKSSRPGQTYTVTPNLTNLTWFGNVDYLTNARVNPGD